MAVSTRYNFFSFLSLNVLPDCHSFAEFLIEHCAGAPLSPDALTSSASSSDSAEALAAHQRLLSQLIPEFLRNQSVALIDTQNSGDVQAVSALLHRFGLNVRLLGALWSATDKKEVKEVLAGEMVVRTVKVRFSRSGRVNNSDGTLNGPLTFLFFS